MENAENKLIEWPFDNAKEVESYSTRYPDYTKRLEVMAWDVQTWLRAMDKE